STILAHFKAQASTQDNVLFSLSIDGSEHEVAGYDGLTYTYRGDGKLGYINSSGNNYALGYDALGRCVWRNLNGTTIYYTYDGPFAAWRAGKIQPALLIIGSG